MRVLTLGTMDLFHVGHMRFFKKCYRMSEEVYLGLNSDEFIEKYKGKAPIMSYNERELAIKEFCPNINIMPNNQTDGTIKDVIEWAKPNLIIIGSDWLRKDYLTQIGLTVDYLEENNISLLYVPYDKTISTTAIKKRFE